MGKRLKKALQALGLILGITIACLAFMPWNLGDVVESLSDTNRCMILRYDRNYSTAYPDDEHLELLVEALLDSTGQFDRARNKISYGGKSPLYRIYLWTPEGRISDIWLCETAFFYEGAQYELNDDDAAALEIILTSCFS